MSSRSRCSASVGFCNELCMGAMNMPERICSFLSWRGSGRVGGDPGDVHVATAVLDNHENVEAAQEDRVDVGEVHGEDRVGLRGQELSPGRPRAAGSRI